MSQIAFKKAAAVPDKVAVKIGLQKLSSEIGIPESELQVEYWFSGSAADVMDIYICPQHFVFLTLIRWNYLSIKEYGIFEQTGLIKSKWMYKYCKYLRRKRLLGT
jgi:hypothetical protein